MLALAEFAIVNGASNGRAESTDSPMVKQRIK
jgi:hypothetical protein